MLSERCSGVLSKALLRTLMGWGGDGVVIGPEDGAVEDPDGTRSPPPPPSCRAGVVKLDPSDPREISGRVPEEEENDVFICLLSAADIVD